MGFLAAMALSLAALGQPALADVVAPENGCCSVAPNGLVDDLARACRSFGADTEVLMADGTTKPISEIEVGDFSVEGGSVTTTEDHHFWNVTDDEWQESQLVDLGDLLLTADGTMLTAVGLDWSTAQDAAAYDLTIDGLHPFYISVGHETVLVHNSDCAPRPRVKPNKPATPPSWTTNQGYAVLSTDANPVAAATRIMDDFYSTGWAGRGAGSEFSQIQKWLSRNFDWS